MPVVSRRGARVGRVEDMPDTPNRGCGGSSFGWMPRQMTASRRRERSGSAVVRPMKVTVGHSRHLLDGRVGPWFADGLGCH